MPMYTFKCIKCEHTEELIMSYNESEQKQPKCDKCFGGYLIKQVSAPSKDGVQVNDRDLRAAKHHNGKGPKY